MHSHALVLAFILTRELVLVGGQAQAIAASVKHSTEAGQFRASLLDALNDARCKKPA